MFSSQLFTHEINEQKYNFRVLKMTDSFFIYIGPEGAESFDDLSIASKAFNGEIVRSNILEPSGSETSSSIAYKLSKRLNVPVYVSCSGIDDRMLRPELEKYLFSEICPKLLN